jgi:hypothetical protein
MKTNIPIALSALALITAIMPKTLGTGSTWEIVFSRDPPQKYMFLTDGANMKVWILDRESLEVL